MAYTMRRAHPRKTKTGRTYVRTHPMVIRRIQAIYARLRSPEEKRAVAQYLRAHDALKNIQVRSDHPIPKATKRVSSSAQSTGAEDTRPRKKRRTLMRLKNTRGLTAVEQNALILEAKKAGLAADQVDWKAQIDPTLTFRENKTLLIRAIRPTLRDYYQQEVMYARG